MKNVSATDTLIPVPMNGKDAVRVTVSPETVLFKKSTAVQTSAVRVTVADGDTDVPNTAFACSVPSSLTVIEDGLAWYSVRAGANAVDINIMSAAGSTPGRALSFSVTYGGKTENRKITVRTVSDGEPGADSVRYWLKGSVTQVVRDALGTCTPSSVSCTALSQAGNGAATAASGVVTKFARRRKTFITVAALYTCGNAVTVVDGDIAVEFYLYRNDVLVDTLTIPVVDSGKPGERGRNGRLPVPYGEYDPAISYTATDLVAPFVLQEGEYYVMNKSETVKGVSPKADYAANGTDATWLHMEFFRAVYAELLMARLGLIGKAVFYDEFMFSQYGRKNGKEVNYSGGYDIPTDAGGLFDPNIVINFLTGALRCRKADITGNINADSGRIGALAIRGNDLVGLVDGVETVRLGIGNVTDVTAAFETRSHEFTMTSTDRDCTTDVEMTRFGYHSGTARRPGEISENRDDGSYTEDTTLSCKVSFKLDSAVTKVEFGRFDVGYNTRSGSFRGTAKGTARLYRVSGSTRTKVSEWELEEQSARDHEVSGLVAGNYEIDISAWLVPAAGTVSEWWGETVFYATAIWVTSGVLSGGKTEIARDGFLCYQGETRYLFFSKGKGLEVKFGNHGLKVGANGVQKLVSGTWKDINS